MFGFITLITADCAVNTPFCPTNRAKTRQPEPNAIWQSGQTYEIAWNGQYNTFVTAGLVDIYLRSLSQPTNDPPRIFRGILAAQEAVDYFVPELTPTGRYELAITGYGQTPSTGPDNSVPLIIKQKPEDKVESPIETPKAIPNDKPVVDNSKWKTTAIIVGATVGSVLIVLLLGLAFYLLRRSRQPTKYRSTAGSGNLQHPTDMNLVASAFKTELGKPVEEEDFGVLIRSLENKQISLEKDSPLIGDIVDNK